jgi:hypothetical protein
VVPARSDCRAVAPTRIGEDHRARAEEQVGRARLLSPGGFPRGLVHNGWVLSARTLGRHNGVADEDPGSTFAAPKAKLLLTRPCGLGQWQ